MEQLIPIMNHLYEFGSGGFYAAKSKEEALKLYADDVGFEDEAEADFVREVPDDELVEVFSEDSTDRFDDPREEQRHLTRGGVPMPKYGLHWVLKITAREWANEKSHGHGHVFGGDQ